MPLFQQRNYIMMEKIKRRRAEEEDVKRLIKDGRIVLADTEILKPHQRKTILKWLNKSARQRQGKKDAKKYYRTEMGFSFVARHCFELQNYSALYEGHSDSC